jgi:nitronate monooxygenase
MEVIINEKIRVFSFTFGLLDSYWIQKLKQNKTIIIGTATSLSEAKALENIGVDIVVANSFEAGGHRGTFHGEAKDSLISAFSLIPQLAGNIHIPVVAAGGIMDARSITSALILGAEGVQMGTAFLPSYESGASQAYKLALLNTDYDQTTLTNAFSGKMARGIRNKFIDNLPSNGDILDYPIQNNLTKDLRQEAALKNNPEYMSLYAGQSAYLCQELSVENLITQLKNNMG